MPTGWRLNVRQSDHRDRVIKESIMVNGTKLNLIIIIMLKFKINVDQKKNKAKFLVH